MPRPQSLVRLLSPLVVSRPPVCQRQQHLFRFSTAAPSTPHEALRAADLAAAEAATDADSAQPPAPKPVLPSDRSEVSKSKTLKQNSKSNRANASRPPSQPRLNLPPPRYLVSRSTNKNLPVYTDFKRGGNLHLTTVRKVSGDATALRDELRVLLNKKNEDVKINSVTGHVIVKVGLV